MMHYLCVVWHKSEQSMILCFLDRSLWPAGPTGDAVDAAAGDSAAGAALSAQVCIKFLTSVDMHSRIEHISSAWWHLQL